MAQFATNAELAGRLGVELTASEQSRADSLLTTASGLIQGAARQRIELVEDDVHTTRATREQVILLPERPVVSVASVTIDGVSVSNWYVDGDELVRRSGWLASVNHVESSNGWGGAGRELVITYTHGFDPIPEAIKAVCLESVVRAWVNPGAAVSERYGSEQVTYALGGGRGSAGGVGLLLTGDERRTVREVVRRGSEAASVL